MPDQKYIGGISEPGNHTGNREARAERLLKAACALIGCCGIALFAVQSLWQPLWSDELLTMHLLGADSLPKLWSGIALGIDGNPPLYLTLAWLIVHALPQAGSAVAVLKLANLALTIAAIVALYRLARRVAPARACWIGVFLFASLNDNVVLIAFELRTYALYFLVAALAMLFQQRLIERHHKLDVVALALLYLALALTHTFGIAYVGCIALAGWLSQPRDGRRNVLPIALATAPAVVAVVAWTPFLLEQLKVAQPYSWIEPAGMPELLETLFGSRLSMWIAAVELCCLAAAAIAGINQKKFQLRSIVHDRCRQPLRYAAWVVIGIAGFTLAGWLISMTVFPLFVPRYFVPQLVAGFALHVAFGDWLLRRRRQLPTAVVALGAMMLPLALLNVVTLFKNPAHGGLLCPDSADNFFETGFVSGELPVIAESPHIFLPRAAYASHRSAYRFPLDWDVVLNYPDRARGNAVDFHIMQGLQGWGPMPSIMSTEDIIRSFPQFLVIAQPGRAWFHNLRATRNVVAEQLAESAKTGGNPSCTLWKVTKVERRP